MIYLGTDHRGYELKEKIKQWLPEMGYPYEDLGAHSFDPQDDYPDFISQVAERVSRDPSARGIVLGGSGQGEAMAANRYSGVRAAVYYGGPGEILKLSRQHNDANVLSLGALLIGEAEARTALELWLSTAFSHEEKHRRRIQKIESLGGVRP